MQQKSSKVDNIIQTISATNKLHLLIITLLSLLIIFKKGMDNIIFPIVSKFFVRYFNSEDPVVAIIIGAIFLASLIHILNKIIYKRQRPTYSTLLVWVVGFLIYYTYYRFNTKLKWDLTSYFYYKKIYYMDLVLIISAIACSVFIRYDKGPIEYFLKIWLRLKNGIEKTLKYFKNIFQKTENEDKKCNLPSYSAM